MTDRPRARVRALLIARMIIGLYLLEVLLNLTRPRTLPNEPVLSIFTRRPGAPGSFGTMMTYPGAVFWVLLAGIAAGVALQVVAAIRPPEGRRADLLLWATLAALLAPFSLLTVLVVGAFPHIALACVPGTAFVLFLLHQCQRFARLPVTMLLAAFAWGAVMVFSLTRACSGLAFGTLEAYLIERPRESLRLDFTGFTGFYRVIDSIILHVNLVASLTIGAGVILLAALFRHRVTDVVTGLVLGAAVGLGYSFVESVLFIRLFSVLSAFNGATAGFEFWIRQSIGLLGGQVTFGALMGAAIGLAARTSRRGRRAVLAGTGLVAAVGGATATETLAGWFSQAAHAHLTVGGVFDTLVVSPFLWLAVQIPFAVLAVLLLVAGLRARRTQARDAVTAEAAEGTAISGREKEFLLEPTLQLWVLVSTWRRYGPRAALRLYRLQRAQLDLAGWRWQQQRADGSMTDAARREGEELRAKVIRLKSSPAVAS